MKPQIVLPILLAWAMAGCAPTTEMAPIALPEASAYRGAPPVAQPLALQYDSWWTLYQDPQLDRLQQQLLQSRPDLGSALARYQQARAVTDSLRAARLPSVDASADVLRNRQSERRPLRGADSPDDYDNAILGLSFDYELDLWGRISQQIASGVAEEQAAQADLAAAQLALQAQLADTVLALRGADREIVLLRETEVAYARASSMVGERHRAGFASGLDVAQAETLREVARSQLHQVQARRDLLEHAIAALVGAHASTFSFEAAPVQEVLPAVPTGLPSELLQRRPDIAAAQRRVTAANASVGVARTAYFPSLRLGAIGGYQSSDLGNLLAAPNLFWAIGPQLLVNVFDGGRRRADIERAEAVLDEAGHTYRASVLAAFQQVEDQLALLEQYGEAAQAELRAVAASQQALDMASKRYRDGAASYLDVVAAQTANLRARRDALDLTTHQRRATVQLVQALGGGWSAETPLASHTLQAALQAQQTSTTEDPHPAATQSR